MNHQRLLRLFILADVFCVVGAVIAGVLFQQTLPEPLRAYADADEPHLVLVVVAFVMVVLLIASWVGLWRGAAWAPAVFGVMWVGCVVIVPFSGPHVGTGIEEMFDFVGTAAGGAILALLLVAREERRKRAGTGTEPVAETPDGAASPDRPDEEMQAHLKACRVHRGLSWLYALIALMMLALPYTGGSGEGGLRAEERRIALLFPLFFFTLFVLHHVVSRGARERKRWARIGSILLACLLLPGVPIGTILGVYLLRNSSWEPRSAAAPAAP